MKGTNYWSVSFDLIDNYGEPDIFDTPTEALTESQIESEIRHFIEEDNGLKIENLKVVPK